MTQNEQPNLLARLVERIQGQESLDLEFKAAKSGFPSSTWETIGAFANTNGGWLLLGVSDAGDVEGVANPPKMLKEFLDQVRNSRKISYPVCGPSDASTETLGGKDVVVIRVAAASRRNRPVYLSGNPYEGTYVRRGQGDYRCTKPEVDRMMREASDVAADSSVLPKHSLDDIDPETLQGYRRRFQTLRPASPDNRLDDIGFLRAIGAWAHDRDRDIEGPTVAGLLMLGKPDPIRRWRGRHLIDFRLLPDDSAGARWLDRVAWEGNLLGAVDAIYPRLVEGVDVPFRLEGATRIEETPVHVAVREAFINLLAHADYSETDASVILRYPHEFVFQNPGSSRLPEADLYSRVRSDPRNPALMRMFRLINLAEEAGTGIATIFDAWRSLGFQVPLIESQTERYEFKLRLREVHMFSDDDRAFLGRLGFELDEPEQVAMVTTLHDGEIDNPTLRRRTGIHPADATKVLAGLRSKKLLVMIGDRRGARYRLSPDADLATIPIDVVEVDDAGQAVLWPNMDRSGPPIDESAASIGSFAASIVSFAPRLALVAGELAAMGSAVRARSHVPSDVLADTIERLCGVVPLSIRELAAVVGRSDPTLRIAVRELVRTGRLNLAFPDRPRHPEQRYVSASSPDN